MDFKQILLQLYFECVNQMLSASTIPVTSNVIDSCNDRQTLFGYEFMLAGIA